MSKGTVILDATQVEPGKYEVHQQDEIFIECNNVLGVVKETVFGTHKKTRYIFGYPVVMVDDLPVDVTTKQM